MFSEEIKEIYKFFESRNENMILFLIKLIEALFHLFKLFLMKIDGSKNINNACMTTMIPWFLKNFLSFNHFVYFKNSKVRLVFEKIQ